MPTNCLPFFTNRAPILAVFMVFATLTTETDCPTDLGFFVIMLATIVGILSMFPPFKECDPERKERWPSSILLILILPRISHWPPTFYHDTQIFHNRLAA